MKELIISVNGTEICPDLQRLADQLVTKSGMDGYLTQGITTLATIAELSGFGFFTDVPVTESTDLWPVHGTWPGPLTSLCKAEYPDN